jgi:hypothetical protein
MDKRLYIAMLCLALLGLAVATYMTIYKWTDNNNM